MAASSKNVSEQVSGVKQSNITETDYQPEKNAESSLHAEIYTATPTQMPNNTPYRNPGGNDPRSFREPMSGEQSANNETAMNGYLVINNEIGQATIGRWGNENPTLFERGWNEWFFLQDKNCKNWEATIEQDSKTVIADLNYGQSDRAVQDLTYDLQKMQGERYLQDELLYRVEQLQSPEVNTEAAHLYLGDWDPVLGTWAYRQIKPRKNK